MSFRDRFYTKPVARAVTSPSAILATGGGAALGILVGLGPIGAVVLGAAAYAARVLAAVPRAEKGEAIAPRSLDQPWRGAVEQVQDARRRFDDAVGTLSDGPLRERLDGVADRLDTALSEAWRIAKAGNVLSRGRKRIDTTRITAELNHARSQPDSARRADTLAAMESQLASAARIDETIADTYDRLLLLDARTDEAVARAVEISVSQSDPAAVQSLEGDVSEIVGDLESLRLAIEETGESGRTGGTGATG